MLLENVKGGYHFLTGIAPYSSGVIAASGYEIVHATLKASLPWQAGFEAVDAHLHAVGRPRHALCGMALRSPEPYTMDGFIGFNRAYCAVLQDWDVFVDGHNPVARTNVAPVLDAPPTSVLHAFSYTIPQAKQKGPTFVVAGAGELASRELVRDGIVRLGEVSPDAMREKATYVMDVMTKRLTGLGGSWDDVRVVNIYSAHSVDALVNEVVLPRIGGAVRHGVHWFLTRPPIVEIEFEMDMRGVLQEIVV